MFTLHCTEFEARLLITTEELAERTGSTARPPRDWPRDRLQGARSASLELLADATKPALDWCWS